jgi:aminopeptidase N
LHLYFSGKPVEARRPPWDGGWIWTTDEKGRPWISVACQGLGASVWFPCKDHQSDEPELGASLTIVVPTDLKGIGNGKLISTWPRGDKLAYTWEVKSPINLYNIIPYIGAYCSWEEAFAGEKGNLQCQYWVLDYNLDKAKNHFRQVPEMLKCFEYWMGPYPFYEDGYKLVEAPHLGMEHQSAIAYGNRYFNGYRGTDLSGSGFGLKWDFIIIHESGHEWFGNNITTQDIADMWVHEGFTNYSETLFTECKSGQHAGEAYVQGIRRNIRNDKPIIGPYGVNKEGSSDMYYKASNMIHTIRTMMQNDEHFRQMLRKLGQTFYHQTVTTQQVEAFLEKESGLGPWMPAFFNQYLRTTQIPILQWQLGAGSITLNWANTVPGFAMKVYVPATTTSGNWVEVGDNPVTLPNKLSAAEITGLWNRNLYIEYSQKPAE